MKKIISSSLVSILAFTLITACSNSEPNLPVLNQNTNISSNTNNISYQYIVTAQSIIDKMPKVKTTQEQEKLVKDFTPLLKSLNRYALDNLIEYAVKVLQENLKPGEQANQTPVAKLIHPILSRMLDVREKASFAHFDLMMLAREKDNAKQEKLIAEFEKSVKKLVKADVKDLINSLNGENGNLNDFIPVGSPLSGKILKILQARI